MSFAGRRVGIAGLGVSGRAAAAALAPLGAELVLVDDTIREAGGNRVWRPADVTVAGLDTLVVSPGWAPTAPLVARAREAGVPVWSEVELAWRLRAGRDVPWLAVTGTNGKTTTVQMLEAMLRAGGRRAMAAGNVGVPLVTAVLDPAVEAFAVELSSFQLHHTYSMRPFGAALLNVAPDHLDWHGSLAEYAADKGRVFAGARRAVIHNAADPLVAELAERAEPGPDAVRAAFTLGAPRHGQLGVAGSWLVDRAFHDGGRRGVREVASLEEMAHLAGPGGRLAPHMVADALAASALALACGVQPDGIGRALREFAPGEHRAQLVGEAREVRFVDDSKATNAHAVAASLAGFGPGTVVWIAGGLAKGARFEDLVAERADRLRAVVLIGRDHDALAEALATHAPGVPVTEIADGGGVMELAVATALDLARPGDAVLLAPAGASMDQFESYADRGEQFQRAALAAGAVTG
ncbi:MAG: UDP-N-acetylmuramoyl-L-alanine--D-glutamate ligase [Bifidobacteriaceae bacterium]|nr:UDP-N-acetylmuramoyl-L-alanine--D-glutamate ligase [Bifidobacteriaceae bacterium]